MRFVSLFVPLVVACLLADKSDAEVIGSINIEGAGTIYVWKSFGDIVIEDNGFWQTNLFDQHFVYDLNLSGVGCHCNAAGYFIKMPSPYGPGESNDYYCDANYVGEIGCPEYDTLESNKHIVTG